VELSQSSAASVLGEALRRGGEASFGVGAQPHVTPPPPPDPPLTVERAQVILEDAACQLLDIAQRLGSVYERRAAKLAPEDRSTVAKRAAKARWNSSNELGLLRGAFLREAVREPAGWEMNVCVNLSRQLSPVRRRGSEHFLLVGPHR
jgi:hypothetical protein